MHASQACNRFSGNKVYSCGSETHSVDRQYWSHLGKKGCNLGCRLDWKCWLICLISVIFFCLTITGSVLVLIYTMTPKLYACRSEKWLSWNKNNDKLYLYYTSTNIYTLSLQLNECKVNIYIYIVYHSFMYSCTSLPHCAYVLLSYYCFSAVIKHPSQRTLHSINVKTLNIHIQLFATCFFNATSMWSFGSVKDVREAVTMFYVSFCNFWYYFFQWVLM